MSANETTLLFGMLALTLAAGLVGGIWLFVWGCQRVLNKLGLTLFVVRKETETAEPDGDDEPKDEPASESNSNIMSGKCRGCGLGHIGLSPAAVDLTPNGIDIPAGTPAVCPRCWVKMNPDKRTNTVPFSPDELERERLMFGPNKAFHTAPDSATGRADPPLKQPSGPLAPQPRYTPRPDLPPDFTTDGPRDETDNVKAIDPKPKETDFKQPDDMTEAELEAATAPEIACDRCGSKHSARFHPLRDGGNETGKFWCQGCVDALGGPGAKPKKKRRE